MAATTTKDPSSAADDDSGKNSGTQAQQEKQQTTLTTQTGVQNNQVPPTQAGQVNNDPSLERPLGRLYNPLSKFSSYNYNISLYMLSPEAYNLLVERGEKGFSQITTSNDPKMAAYVVAQSGGIGTNQSRAITIGGTPGVGPGYDYYIDNLSFTVQTPSADGSKTSTSNTNFKFTIIEPYGYGFLTALENACRAINAASPLLKETKANPRSYNQHYVLAVRFYGYDANGQFVTGNFEADPGASPNSSNAAYERYFNIKILKNDFKLDGKAVTYNFDAAGIPLQAAYGKKRGVVPKDVDIQGATVQEMLDDLMLKLNQYESDLVDALKAVKTNSYSVEFEPGSKIGSALVLNSAQYSPTTTTSSIIKTSAQSTVKDADKANTIQTTQKKISIRAGTPITKAVDNIIVNSTYITDAINNIDTGADDPVQQNKRVSSSLSWYSLTPGVSINGWDPAVDGEVGGRNDWVYDVNYQIRQYDVPYVRTPYATKSKYYGPHKRYDYWFTGLNNEILSYTQTYNNLYFVTTAQGVNPTNGTTSTQSTVGSDVSVTPAPSNADQTQSAVTGRTGEAANQVRTVLYSTGDLAQADITILGDPDFLMQSVTSSTATLSQTFSASKRYGAGLTIDPNGGQVFIEVKFNENTDYNSGSGLMPVSDLVDFYKEAGVREAGIKGIVYRVLQVETSFSGGKFQMKLKCVIVTAPSLLNTGSQTNSSTAQRAETTAQATQNTSATGAREVNGAAAAAQATGENYGNEGRSYPASEQATPQAQQVTVATKQGPVVDDDAAQRDREDDAKLAAQIEANAGSQRA